ncbi:MAG: TIGR03564 family F420-dependent LLM class oxidoreductase [Acidimicrobiales bacterium]
MRVGVFVSETWGAPSTVAQVQARAAEAEQLGFASAWTPYLPWSVDALAAIQAAAAVTDHIELGTAVVPTYLFHPLALARTAATVHDACGGRLTLGIGPSQPMVIESMHGIPFTKPALHTREYLEVLRAAMSGAARVEHRGELYQVASMFGVPSDRDKAAMPILVGALGSMMLRVAGELADGTIATSCDEAAIERVIVPGVSTAAAAAGRPTPRVGTVLAICLSDAAGLEAAREQMYAHFSTYERIPRYARMLSLGGKTRMGDVHVVGDEATVRARLRGFRDAGLTDLLAAPFVPQPATDTEAARRPTLELLADIATRGF